MFETITEELATVHGGDNDAQLIRRGRTMQQYLDCVKQAQGKLDDGQASAMTKAQTSVAGGMTDMLAAGKTFQGDIGACGAKFPIR